MSAIAALILALNGSATHAADVSVSRPLSVYEIKPLTDGIIIGATALAGILPFIFDDHLIYIPPYVDPQQVNPLDRHVIGNRNTFMGNMSDITLGVVLVAPVGLDLLDLGWSPEYVEDMVVFAETLSVNGALVSLFKYTVQRPEPRVFAGTDTERTRYLSFYSGHTAFAFAALSATSMTLGLRYDTGAWPWVATAVIGGTVAAGRVAAGEHFYTDVGVGAIMGTLVGTLVPWLHKREESKSGRFGLKSIGDGPAITWTKRF